MALVTAASVHAADCQFVLGFKTLRDLVGHEVVGECLENEHYNATGDSVQHTTGGLLVWRKADNWTAFTDGYRTWINGPNGLQQRLNTQRFPWEPDYAPGGGIAAPTPAPSSGIATPTPQQAAPPPPSPTPAQTTDPQFAAALQALQITTTGRTLFAWFTEAGPRLAFGAAPKGWTSRYYEPPRNLIVIDRAYRNESADVLAALIAWEIVLAHNTQRRGLQRARWRSGGDCLNEIAEAEQAAARWWTERFGRPGLRHAVTETERWLNDQAQRYHTQTLEAWVKSSQGYREWCAQYGALPAPPSVPTPTRSVDPLLEEALDIMRTTAYGEALYHAYLGSSVTEIAFADLAEYGYPNSDGLYQTRYNRILLDNALRNESHFVRVSALAHEIFHARPSRDYSNYTTEECFEEETLAFRAQAKWWYEKFGSLGKRYASVRERWENTNLKLWLAGRIGDWVRSSDAYQEHCAMYGN